MVTYEDNSLTNDDLSKFISIQEDYISKGRNKLYMELTIPYFKKNYANKCQQILNKKDTPGYSSNLLMNARRNKQAEQIPGQTP